MKFVGTVAEQFKLKGSETLPVLVDRFTVQRAPDLSALTPRDQVLQVNRIRSKEAHLAQTALQIGSHFMLSFEQDSARDAVQRLVEEYVTAEPDQKYAQISPNMFEIHREVTKQQYGECFVLELPLFAEVNYGDKAWNHVTSVYGSKFSFSSPTPPVTQEVKEKARLALADFSEAYAKALRVPVIGDVLATEPRNLELRVAWIPKASDLKMRVEKIRDPDPLLIGKLLGRNYLIAQWNVEGEEPFEHYLAEFKKHPSGRQ